MKTLAAAVLAVAMATGARAAESVLLDAYAATVNDRVITVGDVLRMMMPVERQLRVQYGGAERQRKLQEAYTQVLDQLVDRALILEEFARRKLTVPDRAVDDYVNQIVHERFGGNRSALLNMLARDRMTMAQFRDQTRDGLRVMLLRRQEVLSRLSVSPSAVRAEYERRIDRYRTPGMVDLGMIVLHQGKTDAERAVKREEAEKLRARLAAGEDFAAVAREASEGQKADQGGDWGWVKPSDFRPEIEKAVEALQPGDIGPVLDVGGEFYLITVKARRVASVRPLEDVYAEIKKGLENAQEDRLLREWIDRLKAKHYVRIIAPDYPAS